MNEDPNFRKYRAADYAARKRHEDRGATDFRKQLFKIAKKKNADKKKIEDKIRKHLPLQQWVADGGQGPLTEAELDYCVCWGLAAAEIVKDCSARDADAVIASLLKGRIELCRTNADGDDVGIVAG